MSRNGRTGHLRSGWRPSSCRLCLPFLHRSISGNFKDEKIPLACRTTSPGTEGQCCINEKTPPSAWKPARTSRSQRDISSQCRLPIYPAASTTEAACLVHYGRYYVVGSEFDPCSFILIMNSFVLLLSMFGSFVVMMKYICWIERSSSKERSRRFAGPTETRQYFRPTVTLLLLLYIKSSSKIQSRVLH